MDSSSFLLSVLSGILGGALLFALRELVLIPARTTEQRRRALVQRQLEKLYTPLYTLVKYGKLILKDQGPHLPYISDPISFSPGGIPQQGQDKGKQDLDSIILNYGYLADDELAELLPGLVGPAYFQPHINTPEVVKRMVELIESGYVRLRKEYFGEK